MHYVSTRDSSRRLTASQAIVEGLSRDGGLYLPESIPQLTLADIRALARLSYPERAAKIMKLYLEEFSEEELLGFAQKAYGPTKFDTPAAAPVVQLADNTYIQELWHGPTCAFKDMALQMLPYLLTASLKKTGEEKTVCILVATSGDTGKAALEGFRDVDRTKILVFYPDGGVSEIQKLQMVTQEGRNVGVCAVRGNFDDAQTGVKRIFSDAQLRETLASRGYFLSSANSINWGRVLPQIVYYVSSYCDLLASGAIEEGQTVNVCVPTGNFGNILSGFYAKKMGVPIGRLICASNENNVLTDFIKTGTYDRNRPFYQTASPSMDILISSNLERLLSLLSGSDEEVRGYYLRAKAFLFPGEEDFGITPVEAQSAGTPVLAFGRGGACETVLDGKTGLLFDEQTPESLEACIQKFETEGVAYPPQQIREHSRGFSEQRFEDELRDYCTRRYADWQRELEACSHHETAKEAEE